MIAGALNLGSGSHGGRLVHSDRLFTSTTMANPTSNAHAHALPTRKRTVKPLPQAVPDDWDADDNESEDDEGAGHAWTDTGQSCAKTSVLADEQRDNARVWQEA